jgi:hypothetical protein
MSNYVRSEVNCLWTAVIVLSFAIIAVFVGTYKERQALLAEAVKRGYAVWEVDAGGSTTFKWKEPKE